MKLFDNAAKGARWGLAVGAMLSVWALVLAFVQGSRIFHYRSGEAISVFAVVPIYLASGLLAGLLFGLLLKFLSSRVVAALLGMLVAAPFEAAVVAMRGDYVGWTRVETLAVIIFPVIFGIPGGLILRRFILDSKSE